MVKRQLTLTDGYLHIPVYDSGKMYYMELRDSEDFMFAEFYVALSAKPSAYYPIKFHHMEGKTVTVCCERDETSDAVDMIIVGGSIEDHPELYSGIYKESERQQVHFSSRRGWLNDPNGLVYADGKFRMCYQHNPLGHRHGGVNVSWGLAVSEDGVHFKEYPDVIFPQDTKSHIASGSAIVDTDNVSGMGNGTIIATFTSLESQQFEGRPESGNRGQMLVYSTDGGYSFKYFPNNPIISIPKGCWWRDPKILILDDGSFCIAVYETHEGEDCVGFYSSTDCVNWKFESRTMDLHECPDLFRLPVAETGENLWVLYGARGMYRVGVFEDYKFRQIQPSMYMDYGSATYAGQTWNSHPDTDCRYHIAWMNEDIWGKEIDDLLPFSQSMTLMCKFTLHKTNDGYRLFRAPIDAVDSLRSGNALDINETVSEEMKHKLPIPGDAELSLKSTQPLKVMVNEHGFTYDPTSKLLTFSSGKEYKLTSSDNLSVRIVTDVRSVEFFICGEISASYSDTQQEKNLTVQGKDIQINGKIWQLNSIWENNK